MIGYARNYFKAFLALSLIAASSAGVAGAAATSDVRTLAGTGQAGMADGPVTSATFLLPVGVAVARDGTIYVSDQTAQRIRAISNGEVRTVAGSGPLLPDGLSVAGGYRDGPALSAHFNVPSGLAIGPDGALYIADTINRCIRKLDRDVVSTVSGKCGTSGDADGSAATARYVEPRALAFDAKGNLYIADYGGGLRRLTTRGVLETVSLKSTVEKTMMGVAVDRADADGTIAIATQDQVIEYQPLTGYNEAFLETVGEGDRPFGTAVSLVALDHREFLFTDPVTNTLRYLRVPARPYVNTVFTRTIAGGPFERPVDNAGFVDGPGDVARFYDIAGIDLRNGEAIVADAGNRRIRAVALPEFRLTGDGGRDLMPADGKHFEMAYLGSSIVSWDSLGADSVCAQMEARLDASHRVGAPARCQTVRIDGSPLPALRDYIVTYLAPLRLNLIVMHMSPTEVELIDDKKPVAQLMNQYRAEMKEILDALRPSHTKLAIFWGYNAGEINGAEYFYARDRFVGEHNLPSYGRVLRQEEYLPLQPMMTSLGIPQYDLYQDLLNYEISSSGTGAPLYNTTVDGHPNARGNAFFAEKITSFLLSLQPEDIGL